MLLHKNVMHNTSDCSYCTEKENIIGKNLSKVQKVTPKYVDCRQTKPLVEIIIQVIKSVH